LGFQQLQSVLAFASCLCLQSQPLQIFRTIM
jgi:hypothetical protein